MSLSQTEFYYVMIRVPAKGGMEEVILTVCILYKGFPPMEYLFFEMRMALNFMACEKVIKI